MSHPKYVERGNRLGHLIEECGEVIQAAGKCVRFGRYSYNPEPHASSENNEDYLMREIADLEGAIKRLKKRWGYL